MGWTAPPACLQLGPAGADHPPTRTVRPGQLTSLSEPQLPHLQTGPGDTRPASDPSHPSPPLSCPPPPPLQPSLPSARAVPFLGAWLASGSLGAVRRWEPLALRAGSVGSPPTPRNPGKGRGAWGMNLAATWIPALLSIPPSCFGDETPAEQTALKEPPRPSRWSHLEAGGGQSPRAQGGPCPHPALDHPGGLPCPAPTARRGPLRPPPEAPRGILPLPTGRLSQRLCWRHPLPSGHLLQERGSCSGARGQHAPMP